MSKKQILTNAEIKKDIISAMENPPEESEASDKKGTVIAFIVACFLLVMSYINPPFFVRTVLAGFALLIGASIFRFIYEKRRFKKWSIHDYDVTTEVVHSIDEEHYLTHFDHKPKIGKRKGGLVRTVPVNNYSIRFENGKIWRIPKKLYSWNERLRMQDLGIYRTTHRGDTLIVVTKKDTGKIIVAYHTDFFEYKN
ncbi:MAG: hypothetical protein IJX13_07475 [Clostridia bacterium]|nr:hypothetical protein [Clostridia bacterium]